LGTIIDSRERRGTKQREAILKVLRGTTSHPTADWIYDEVRKAIPNISKGTVYRNLKVLRETGQISELNLSGTVGRFEGRQDKHYHFRCERCGRVLDVDEPVDTELDHRVAAKTGLKISYHQLEFRGLCRDCQQRTTRYYVK
jgi:Fe2+ or Zn2+ uptake regulation protein